MNESMENMEIMTEETEETTDMVVVEDGSIVEVDSEPSLGQKVMTVAGLGLVGAAAYKFVLKPVGKKVKAFGEKTICKLADKIRSKAQAEEEIAEYVESEVDETK